MPAPRRNVTDLTLPDCRVEGATPARQVRESRAGKRPRASPISAGSRAARMVPERGRDVKITASGRAPLSPPPLSDEPGPATGRSGAYPNGTLTRKPGPACRTQHACHELAACYRINPAKGINVLADEGLLEQRRRRLAKRYILGGRNGAGKTNIGI
jgi:hypothetical protein